LNLPGDWRDLPSAAASGQRFRSSRSTFTNRTRRGLSMPA